MTSQYPPDPLPLQPTQIPPDGIRQLLGHLIRYYARTPSRAVAGSIVRHIDQLCSHPRFDGDRSERCALLRLKAHWRWLARDTPEGRVN